MTEYVINIKSGNRWVAHRATRYAKLAAARSAQRGLGDYKTRILRIMTSIVKKNDFK